jgi:rhodanese-related sulfurtransferase/glyoxylase-like metal-dependent hydrolase (beta-lactamase superfamily II)
VSGHRELSARTGAEIVFGAMARAGFPHRAVRDGDELRLGALVLRFLETPGHTPESVTILVLEGGVPRAAFTGDTLFIGDVGRPDLAGARGFTPQQMAGMLYDSLREKLLALPDDVLVYPAHGAGSLCGRNMSNETWSTIGEQRLRNYALQPMPKERFVEMMTTDLPEAPRYFSMDVELNRAGAPSRAEAALPSALGTEDVAARVARGAQLLDVRTYAAFGAGHVPGSVNIGLGGQFASWAGTLLDAARETVLITDDEAQAQEAVTRLARVGLERVVGYLEGGIAAWDAAGKPIARIPQMPVDELMEELREERPGLQVLDVRRPGEYSAGHVPGAVSVPLDRLEAETPRLDTSRPTVVICAGGYRSSAGTALLRRAGFEDLYNVVGGTSAWVAAGYPTERPS